MQLLEDMMDYAHQITLKWHLIIGFLVGAGPLSFFVNHWEDAVVAFIVGFLTAFGAGLAKLTIAKFIKNKKKTPEKPS